MRRAKGTRGQAAPPARPVLYRCAAGGRRGHFEAFRARWERPQLHAVFTAHPTFLRTEAQAEAAARSASAPGAFDDAVCAVPATRAAVTLEHEHRQAIAAMASARKSRSAASSSVT